MELQKSRSKSHEITFFPVGVEDCNYIICMFLLFFALIEPLLQGGNSPDKDADIVTPANAARHAVVTRHAGVRVHAWCMSAHDEKV